MFGILRLQIYHCIEHGNNQPLDSFATSILESGLSDMYTAAEDTADNGFCGLAEMARNVPQLLEEAIGFLQCADQQAREVTTTEATKILTHLKTEEERLVFWLSDSAHTHPSETRQTSTKQTESRRENTAQQQSRTDLHVDAPQAASYNTARLCRILVLDSIAKIARVLARADMTTQSWSEDELDARSNIQKLVDEICASMPRYLGEPIESEGRHSGEEEAQGAQSQMTREELIANWSQMKSILSKGSELDCVPARQRQWMSNYVRMLSDEKSRSAKISGMPSIASG